MRPHGRAGHPAARHDPAAARFIDCKVPGSQDKENHSPIGSGVTQSADQVVNITEPHGFSLGVAAMPPGTINNPHIHYTAKVLMTAARSTGCASARAGRLGRSAFPRSGLSSPSKARPGSRSARVRPGRRRCSARRRRSRRPPGVWRRFVAVSGPAMLAVLSAGDARTRIEWPQEICRAPRATGLARDHDGYIAPMRMLPESRAAWKAHWPVRCVPLPSRARRRWMVEAAA